MESLTHFVIRYLNRVPWYFWVGIVLAFLGTVVYNIYQTKAAGMPGKVACIHSVFVAYFLALVLITFGTRLPDPRAEVELVPFRSYFSAFGLGNRTEFYMILCNVVLFLPFGILLPLWFQVEKARVCKFKRLILHAVGLSFGIELIQLITYYGCFELDDMINNVTGAMIGYWIWWTVRKGREICLKRSSGKKTAD